MGRAAVQARAWPGTREGAAPGAVPPGVVPAGPRAPWQRVRATALLRATEMRAIHALLKPLGRAPVLHAALKRAAVARLSSKSRSSGLSLPQSSAPKGTTSTPC
eukprot:9555317-Lingulodinium_polyedra.AAC.1